MKTVILSGGMGMRLREETEYKPKPMVDIGGKPILWHIMKIYSHYSFNEFVICLGYRGNMIKQYFLDYEAMNNDFTINLGDSREITYHGNHDERDFTVTLVDTGLNTNTGGRVRQIERYIEDDTFMVTYGDGLTNIDVPALVKYHKQQGKLATVTAVQATSRFGVMQVDDGGMITSFQEKPSLEGWINAGFFVFDRKVFDYLDSDESVLEEEPLHRLAAEGQLAAYRHTGPFLVMDTYREYVALNKLWDEGGAPWKIWK